MDHKTPSFVVGIGASAGGLEAIERMIDHMPEETGMAFVIVQHLSPDFKSLMNELLSRRTSIPIHLVEDGMLVESNSIYLIPAKKEMVISDGHLLLTDKDPHASLTLPIDHFFRSLAQDCGQQSVAVVLSGTGSDGSRGVTDIHEAGGLVIAQSEETAKFDGMPRGARDSGAVDLFLAPEDIPRVLQEHAERSLGSGDQPVNSPSLDETGLQRMFKLIRESYGLDFSLYKLNTIVRRTERRMQLRRVEHINEYARLLEEDVEELDQLYRDLLIGVTRFFRDNRAYEAFCLRAIEPLVQGAEERSELRVWVACTATGEEAYSLAILLDEAIAASGKELYAKIFATDVHRDSLEFASQGIYAEQSVAEITPERLAKYFEKLPGDRYKVSPDLRRMIVFAPHNLVKDAPFTKIDLITCRNMLIYLQSPAQKRVLSLFHFGLRAGGCIMLGPSESAGEISDEFDTLDQTWRIYRKRRNILLPPDMRLKAADDAERLRSTGLPAIGLSRPADPAMLMSTYDAVLDQFMPPSILVTEDGAILHIFGDAGRFLSPERGRHTSLLFDRLVSELRAPVSTVFRKALKDSEKVTFASVPCRATADGAERCHVTATPLLDPRQRMRTVVVQIEPVPDKPTPADSGVAIPADKVSSEQLASLEAELNYTKENLQATIEELETSNEELQATNEEMVASNEELQSTNEELHSVNEELYTVNAEHQNKITQLSELSRDMDKLLECTEVHTVFLDTDLRIRKFTPRIAESFSILPQDIGRRIDSFTHSIVCEDLAAKIEGVVATGEAYEEEVPDQSDNWFLMRIVAYRSAVASSLENGVPVPADRIDGVMLILVDITKLRSASQALRESVEQRDKFLAMLSHELRNPLATIVNATHLLHKTDTPSADSEPRAVIRRQSQHMSRLLDDLLDVTRVSHGKIRLNKCPFDLQHAIDAAVESVAARCEVRNQAIDSTRPEQPIWINGSEPRILQVLSNLLTNASKYSPQGATIHLEVRVDGDGDGDEVKIVVRDEGVGIPPEQLERVFDLFVQSDRTLDRADGGLGIGLTLVRSLVELHKGRVAVHSDGEGTGSEFTVWLPVCESPPVSIAEDPDTENSKKVERIVLVEDNVDACRMLAFLLEDAGYQVSIANDGVKGLETIRSKKPDVAIIDVGLPGLNGYDLARAVREDDDGAVCLIALTGYSQASDRTEALKAGFDEHLVKPVDPELLSRLLLTRPGRGNI